MEKNVERLVHSGSVNGPYRRQRVAFPLAWLCVVLFLIFGLPFVAEAIVRLLIP